VLLVDIVEEGEDNMIEEEVEMIADKLVDIVGNKVDNNS